MLTRACQCEKRSHEATTAAGRCQYGGNALAATPCTLLATALPAKTARRDAISDLKAVTETWQSTHDWGALIRADIANAGAGALPVLAFGVA